MNKMVEDKILKTYVGIPCSMELRSRLKLEVAKRDCKSYEDLIWKLLENE